MSARSSCSPWTLQCRTRYDMYGRRIRRWCGVRENSSTEKKKRNHVYTTAVRASGSGWGNRRKKCIREYRWVAGNGDGQRRTRESERETYVESTGRYEYRTDTGPDGVTTCRYTFECETVHTRARYYNLLWATTTPLEIEAAARGRFTHFRAPALAAYTLARFTGIIRSAMFVVVVVLAREQCRCARNAVLLPAATRNVNRDHRLAVAVATGRIVYPPVSIFRRGNPPSAFHTGNRRPRVRVDVAVRRAAPNVLVATTAGTCALSRPSFIGRKRYYHDGAIITVITAWTLIRVIF